MYTIYHIYECISGDRIKKRCQWLMSQFSSISDVSLLTDGDVLDISNEVVVPLCVLD